MSDRDHWLSEIDAVSDKLTRLANELEVAADFFQSWLPLTATNFMSMSLRIMKLNNRMVSAINEGLKVHGEDMAKHSLTLEHVTELLALIEKRQQGESIQ